MEQAFHVQREELYKGCGSTREVENRWAWRKRRVGLKRSINDAGEAPKRGWTTGGCKELTFRPRLTYALQHLGGEAVQGQHSFPPPKKNKIERGKRRKGERGGEFVSSAPRHLLGT